MRRPSPAPSGRTALFRLPRTRGGAEALLLGQDSGSVTRPEVTRRSRCSCPATSSSRRRARQADARAREPPGLQGVADAARGARRSALAPGARAGAAGAGGHSGRVPDVWATLARTLQALLLPSEDRSLLSSQVYFLSYWLTHPSYEGQ